MSVGKRLPLSTELVAAVLGLVNCIIYALTVYIAGSASSQPSFFNLSFVLNFSKIIQSLYSIVQFYIASLLQVVLVAILTRSIALAFINRICFLSQLWLLGVGSPGIDVAFQELILIVVGLLVIKLIPLSHKEHATSKPAVYMYRGELKCANFYLSCISAMLASHSVTNSLLVLYTIHVLKSNSYMFSSSLTLLAFSITPLVQLVAIVILMHQRALITHVVIYGMLSGIGLMGTVPLLYSIAHSSAKHSILMYTTSMKQSTRGIYLGTTIAGLLKKEAHGDEWYYYDVTMPYYVDLSELNTPHIVIIGSSGTGKTSLAKHVILESKKKYGYNIIVIDPHGEYKWLRDIHGFTVVDVSTKSINPLTLGNASPRERASQLAHILSLIFNLGFLQRRMLEEVIVMAYTTKGISMDDPSTWNKEPPTLSDLVEVCKKALQENPEYGRILPYLVTISDSLSAKEWLSIDDVLEHDTIIDLSSVSNDFARAVIVDTLMYLLLSRMYRMSAKKVQLVIDEARSLLPRTLTREVLNRLFVESRKFGFSIVVISQEISRVPRELINNAGIRIFFLLNDPRSIEEAATILGGASRSRVIIVAELLRTLKPHTFLVHVSGFDAVYVVKSPVIEDSKR